MSTKSRIKTSKEELQTIVDWLTERKVFESIAKEEWNKEFPSLPSPTKVRNNGGTV